MSVPTSDDGLNGDAVWCRSLSALSTQGELQLIDLD